MAARECFAGAPGPAYLEIPRDVLDREIELHKAVIPQPGGYLPPDHAPPVLEPNLPHRHRADYQRGRLRAGISATADDKGNEQRQDHRARDLVFVISHGGGGEHLADEQHG